MHSPVRCAFFIEPSAAREAVNSGRGLLVEVWGDKFQYRRVTVMDRPETEGKRESRRTRESIPMTVFDTTTEEGRSLKTLWALDDAFGRSLRDGLAGAEAPEPPARLGPTGSIPNADGASALVRRLPE